MDGNARRAILAASLVLCALAVTRPTQTDATAGSSRHASVCIYDHLSLRSAPGVCRPRARAYPPTVVGAVPHAIYDASLTFGIPYAILLGIAECESGLNSRAAYSGHYGLYQFLPATFRAGATGLRKETGIGARSYWNALDAAYVAGYMFVTGKSALWSCETATSG